MDEAPSDLFGENSKIYVYRPRCPTLAIHTGAVVAFRPRYAVDMLQTAALLALFVSTVAAAGAISLPSCDAGAAKYNPCELRFDWNQGEMPADQSPFRDDALHIEFRSPDATTYLVYAFWSGGRTLSVRFTPNQPGNWTYRVTSTVKRYDGQQAGFTVADNANPGFVSVANTRHWWTDNLKPHLWMSAEVPWLDVDEPAYKAWIDARKQDGFNHVRGVLLTQDSAHGGPLVINSQPSFGYFDTLDDRILYAHQQGFTLDLIFADRSFLTTGLLEKWEERTPLIRYLVARYGALNVSWQGIEKFEDCNGSRPLLKQIATLLDKYDSFHHPRSTDAKTTSSMLLHDDWESYIIESSPDPQLAAVEHQITAVPQVHVIRTTDPDAFRRELWQSTTNGEYPTVNYQATQNPANIQTIRTWFKVMSDVRHWEFEPFFDVDGARAAGLDNVEYVLYAEQPGTLEISFSEKHKYNPRWVNPRTGEVTELKDVKEDTYSITTPGPGDWVLQIPREGRKEGMLKSYKFESVPAPIQEVELNPVKIPFEIAQPQGDQIRTGQPIPFSAKLKKTNRATRFMQYMWTGDVIVEGDGPRVIALGASGTFQIPENILNLPNALLNVRLSAINANGKAYSIEKVYQLSK